MVSDEARMVVVVMERRGEGRSHDDDTTLRSTLTSFGQRLARTSSMPRKVTQKVGCALTLATGSQTRLVAW